MSCQVIQAPGSGSDIVARDSRLVKGGFLDCGCFCVKVSGGKGVAIIRVLCGKNAV